MEVANGKRVSLKARPEAIKAPPRRTPGIIYPQLMHPPLPRLKPQPLSLSMMIFKRRKAIQKRADEATLAKALIQDGREEAIFEHSLGIQKSRGDEQYAAEWAARLAAISKAVKLEYARKDRSEDSARDRPVRLWLWERDYPLELRYIAGASSDIGPGSDAMITLTEATIDDVTRLSEIHRLSFGPSLLFQRLFGDVDPADMAAHLRQRMTSWFSNPKCLIYKAVDEQNTLMSYAMWDVPEPEVGWPADVPTVERPRSFPNNANQELALDFFTKLDKHGKAIPGRHWHLQILATDPAYYGKGAGSRLLLDGMRRAQEQGLAIYLDATEAGKPLYVKYGFVECAEPIALKDGSTSVQPMVWKPAE
ncbi:hypothetical protein OIV83_006421 [Microbotryomycetes sp. JL201]|nr:hypothetical protein OIV83_006421 [Microbotryomycetes sp. JL201]